MPFISMSGFIPVAAILMILTGVQAQHSVIVSSQSLCAVIGSTVKIPCEIKKPKHQRVSAREWYRVLNSNGDTQDLNKDPQYTQRISESTWYYNCELTLRNVRLSDSGVYNFKFKTENSDWISASSGVYLNVTDLQVKVDSKTVRQGKVRVICSSTCSLSAYYTYSQYYASYTYYRWYRDNQQVSYGLSTELPSTDPYYEGSYSCEVSGSSYRSPAVCVLGKQCWVVTYTPEHVCALKGASAELSCSYKHPEAYTVKSSVWFIKEQVGAEPVDLRDNEEYQDRVQYIQNSQNHCAVKINNLTDSDAQTYRVRFYTDDPNGKYTGQPGVTLSVTDLKVVVSNSDSHNMQLNCKTSCSLSNNPTYIWYKNEDHVIQCKSASCPVAAVSGEVRYSCAVEGYESFISPPVYSPKNTTAVLYPSGERLEGDSVSLSCSSDANPPVHTYSWFMQTEAADTLLITEQNYSITNISSEHSSFYYCTAQNELGQQNSTLIHLKIFNSEENSGVKHFLVGLFIFLALLLITGTLWIWRRKSRSAKDDRKTGQSGQTSPSRGRPGSDDQDGFLYANVHFKPSPTEDINPYSTVQHPLDTTQEEDVQYAAVKFIKDSTATKPVTADDPALLYSVILRNKPTT